MSCFWPERPALQLSSDLEFHRRAGSLRWDLTKRTRGDLFAAATKQGGVAHVELKPLLVTASAASAIPLTSPSIVEYCFGFSSIRASSTDVVRDRRILDASCCIGCSSTAMLLNLPGHGLAMFTLRFFELHLLLRIFVLLVKALEESSSAGAARTVVGSATGTLFFHAMYGVGDIEGFLKRTDARRATLAVTGADRRKQRRIDGSVGRRDGQAGPGCRDRCGRRLLDPRMGQEFVDGVSLSRIDTQ